jgi:YidC/Oxa1 family membrane protein insertase
MYWCFLLAGGYGVAILIFTVCTKIVLFPLSLIAQKNSIKMVKMQPELTDIKAFNSGNGELIVQETKALYKREHYSTIVGILPLLFQIPIILGLIDVIYKPLKYLAHVDASAIDALSVKTSELLSVPVSELGYGAQIRIMDAIQHDPSAFAGLPEVSADIIAKIHDINVSFLGISLSEIPSFGSITILVPIISGLSALLLCVAQNKYNVLQAEQGFIGKWGMTIFLVAFSSYFAYALPSGLGLYWTAGNLLSIPVLALCNVIFSPKKYIDYENRTVRQKPPKDVRLAEKEKSRELAKRETADAKRFAQTEKKRLVIYSEAKGYYKYFDKIIESIVKHSGVTIHYVTSDPDDTIFDTHHEQIVPYYIGPRALISFMLRLDTDMALMTLPDLETYHIKRSIVRKDIEYIYTDHGIGSFHLLLREHALDHFDTVFCYGPNHVAEVRETERAYGLPQKTLVKTGFGLLDTLIGSVEKMDLDTPAEPDAAEPAAKKRRPQILVAPSWQKDNIMDSCLNELVANLSGKGYRIIVRPHPEYIKRFPRKMEDLLERYKDRDPAELSFETDFSSNVSVYSSDLLITDWSSIAMDFSFARKKPSLFINTTMKIMNPNYKKIPCVPIDLTLRDAIGVSLDPKDLAAVAETVRSLLKGKATWSKRIDKVLHETMYDLGHGGESGGAYIAARVKEIEYLEDHPDAAEEMSEKKTA